MTICFQSPHDGLFHQSLGNAVAVCAESWIDVPFHWQGTVRAGCDCKGLIVGIARELGRPEAESLEALRGDYGGRVPVRDLQAGLSRLFDKMTERQPGDVLLIKHKGMPQHLSICAPRPNVPNRVIEALAEGVMRVRPYRRSDDEIDSIWRWREQC
jgi:cell wall-associated NlpC family hydrolase